MKSDALSLKDVSHVYVTDKGASLAVHRLHLTVPSGRFVSLVGPSGCGKTTVLSIIAGLLKPTVGTVSIFGKSVSESAGEIGYMLQQDYLFPWRTIMDNAVFGLELMNRRTKDREQYVKRLLADMGLQHRMHSWPHQLSGGMRQRVALVRTLATEPNLMLLDEPFSALDYQTKLQLEELVWNTLRSQNKTAVLVTHDLAEAIAMSDEVVMMGRDPGTIRYQVTIPDEIRTSPPLTAREIQGFNRLFHELWRQLEDVKQGEVTS